MKEPSPPSALFHRAELLLGRTVMDQLAGARIILFGAGGVGSWCAEALVRTGIRHLTLVDNDVICLTNVNRQLQATAGNAGQVKVHELRARLMSLNPQAVIEARAEIYSPETRDAFNLSAYDYVIDAIDSLACKTDLLATAMTAGKRVYSSMGAACKLDPSRIRVASIWKTSGCPLAREVRRGLRQRQVAGDCLCLFSDEHVPNRGSGTACGSGNCLCPAPGRDGTPTDVWCRQKARINGSLVHVTGVFGFLLAGLVVQDVFRRRDGADEQDKS